MSRIETTLLEDSISTPPDMYVAFIKSFSILFLLLALILVGFWLLKRVWSKGAHPLSSDRWIKIIAAAPLTPKKMVVLVEVAGELMALGITDEQITLLTKITDESYVQRLKTVREENPSGTSFYRHFKSVLQLQQGQRKRGE